MAQRYRVPLFMAALAAAWLPAARLAAESLTVETTFPAPSAVYGRVVTTGAGGASTTLSRDGGNVILVPPANTSGKVGIGTASPAKKLDVSGNFGVTGVLNVAQDIKVGANSVITGFTCGGGISCVREGNNTLRIELSANPVDCAGFLSACSNGFQTYTVTTPAKDGGAACPYTDGQRISCAQPVNCVGSWSACSAACGGGTKTYTITTPASGGGTACPAQSGQTMACNTQACVINGTCTGSCTQSAYGWTSEGCPATRTAYCTATGPLGQPAQCSIPQGFYGHAPGNGVAMCGFWGCTVTCTPR